jgi:phosphomannomutase
MSDLLEQKIEFAKQIQNEISAIKEIPAATQESIKKYLAPGQGKEPNLWEAALLLGNFYNTEPVNEDIIKEVRAIISNIREFQGKRAMVKKDAATVVLGTSGWRGVIGEDFTLFNIHKVLRATAELLQSDLYLKYNKFASFSEVQKRGILVMRDNRFMGDVWIEAAKKELTSIGVKVYDAGMCPTGVGSAYVKDQGLAGMVNFTPSHNPMEYAGIKFNPADGGGAENDLSSVIQDAANKLMHDDSFKPAEKIDSSLVEKINATTFFRKYIEEKSIVFDLPAIRKWLSENKNDFLMIVDFMHGASRGYVQELLGWDIWKELIQAGSLITRHEDEDYSFHGMKPEPSAANQKPLLDILKKHNRTFSLGMAMDPDGDRIRYADSKLDIDMNLFSVIAYSGLLERGIKGAIVNSVPSSGFAGKIARENGQINTETMVGFKNFRRPFLSGDYVMGFEESDGISFIGHTLEKCALSGFLAALTAISTKNVNLSDQYQALRLKYGYFYPGRAGVDVKGVSVEEWQVYKAKVVENLQNKLYKKGDTITIGGIEKTIKNVLTIDGLKIFMDDDSWILMRPSGTEPKFRYYYEVVSDSPMDNPQKELEIYNDTAASILQRARDMV